MTVLRRALLVLAFVAAIPSAGAQEPPPPRAVGHVVEVEVEQTITTTGRIVSTIDGKEEGLEDRTSETTRLVFLDRIDRVDAAARPDVRTRFVVEGALITRHVERELGADETGQREETKPLSVVGRHLTSTREGEFFDPVLLGDPPAPASWDFDPEALVGEPERWLVYGGPREGAPAPADILARSGVELLPGWPAQLVRRIVEELTGLMAAFGKEALREMRWSVETGESVATYRARFSVAVVQDGEREESEVVLEVKVAVRAPSRELPAPPGR